MLKEITDQDLVKQSQIPLSLLKVSTVISCEGRLIFGFTTFPSGSSKIKWGIP